MGVLTGCYDRINSSDETFLHIVMILSRANAAPVSFNELADLQSELGVVLCIVDLAKRLAVFGEEPHLNLVAFLIRGVQYSMPEMSNLWGGFLFLSQTDPHVNFATIDSGVNPEGLAPTQVRRRFELVLRERIQAEALSPSFRVVY